MRIAGRLGLGLLGMVGAIVAVVAIRTVAYQSPAARGSSDVQLADTPQIDVQRAAQHLAEAIAFRTVSHQDASDNAPEEWHRLRAWLADTYPAAHAAMTREVVGLGGRLLVGRVVEDRRAVLGAHVVALAVAGCRVVDGEEHLQDLAIGDELRIGGHAHHLGVPSGESSDHVVASLIAGTFVLTIVSAALPFG